LVVAAADLLPVGALRWAAIAVLLVLGAVCALGNWALVIALLARRLRSTSFVPLIGGVLLALGIGAIPEFGWRRWAGVGLSSDSVAGALSTPTFRRANGFESHIVESGSKARSACGALRTIVVLEHLGCAPVLK
jgi:hypothetical protein